MDTHTCVGGIQGGAGKRERENFEQAPHPPSAEPDVGPHLTTLRPWPDLKSSRGLNQLSHPDTLGICMFG